MGNQRERILIVENDPLIADLVGRQALQSIGYQVSIVGDAAASIAQAAQLNPDVLIVDLNLPGLSGKDLLVMLNAQRMDIPVIVLAQKGMEGDLVQAFRLGASDYLLWPLRDAEVVSAVERVLKQVRGRREREHLAAQLQQTNQELQNRVRELTTLFSVGKAVTSITDQRKLFDRLMDAVMQLTQADISWFLLREDAAKPFSIAAYRNLPASILAMPQTWDDGISSLVALSGETLAINGDPLKRFPISMLGEAALIVPVRVQKQVIGLMVAVRKANQPFNPAEQSLMGAMADYTAISLVNSRLFRALEDRARSLQQIADNAQANEKAKNDLLSSLNRQLRQPLDKAGGALKDLLDGNSLRFSADQRRTLLLAHESVQQALEVIQAVPSGKVTTPTPSGMINLNEMVRQSLARLQRPAQQRGVSLVAELSAEPVKITADPRLIEQILDGLISNAVKFSTNGRQVVVRLDRTPESLPHLVVRDQGRGIAHADLKRIFEPGYQPAKGGTAPFGGLGIRLSLMNELITSMGGKIWAESMIGEGSAFHVTLPNR